MLYLEIWYKQLRILNISIETVLVSPMQLVLFIIYNTKKVFSTYCTLNSLSS